jgi:hypothetical protein
MIKKYNFYIKEHEVVPRESNNGGWIKFKEYEILEREYNQLLENYNKIKKEFDHLKLIHSLS